MKRQRPVIGITTYGRGDHAVDNFLFGDHYVAPAVFADAVRRAGGVPVLLPPGGDEAEDWLALADGFILTGGADINPALYAGNTAHPALQALSEERDTTEMALTNALLADGKTPVLFICRGMQLLNVTLGGSLHEHIPDVQAQDIHRGEDGGWTVQPVDVKKDSNLFETMGVGHVETYSGHHQAVKTIAEGLTPVAHAPDGIVEALEIGTHPFFIAVQWHPEVSAEDDSCQQALFDGLVRAAQPLA